ncbi:ubiquinone biosynthesis protein coq-4 [Pyrenophora tritici-repentis Pt-1C-BFP]|uniref:Ubiquinone biosynthesis protein coq4, mitochondrial n=1 Tax=Pyrenophora tritici-repentis (strain Pt-1C-BFP) TaxID=426418 RepID=COQ4_PYRTR|nr:ubiquinone biosynthesis protein coq-4 [Pyrenophora tritici-repentis Pt-1C-BFP]B2WBF0.1 RecName: Full=Ubiquinone biosynthesis protein coq4, mitochondrial; AltName: Full=Coenzyme Q biosynthesis protein 4; Flags: Precursor [Pyrenophora tritici-repentis Pt-1C-BFP]EDU49882.1 ubiquinone biosynthesis protein coq-4 [Pyrenophora tritici-repentis Pt-1C-BFP]
MAKHVRMHQLQKLTLRSLPPASVLVSSSRCFSVLNRPPPNYEGHIPLTRTERLGLALGSGIGSFLDPQRGDLIASFGEATAQPYFIYKLRDRMLLNPTGRRILRDRPRLTSTSLDIPRLRNLPPNTVGYAYAAWLDREGVSPDTRAAVQYIDDEECAYVMQRYRECHDFYHALVGLPVFREGEVALKAFEFANTGLPMTGLAVFSAFTLKKAEWRRFWDIYGPWATRNGAQSDDVINVYWEEELETDIDKLRERLGIEKPPDLRAMRKAEREARKKEKETKGTMVGAAT